MEHKMSDLRSKALGIISDDRQWGIIEDYIMTKMAEHREPVREGVPKGEKIGFPGNKYVASIYVGITNWKLKDIAVACSVSYGLLRKWKTEVDFQEACQNHRHEFVSKIIGRIKEEISIQEKRFEDYFNDSGPDPFDRKTDSQLNRYERILSDAKQFNQKVTDEINERVLRIANISIEDTTGEKLERYKLLNAVAGVILAAEGKGFLKPDPLYLKHLTSHVINLLEQNSLTEKDKKFVVTTLKFIERYLANQIN